MSDYKRLFSYLYFYQHKIKEKNSGFVKVEIRNNQCRLQLSVKGGFLNQAPRWDIYGFKREEQELRLWRLGCMNAGNGQGEWGVQMPFARFLGEAADLSHMAGLLLYGNRKGEDMEQLPRAEDSGKDLICATVWDDLPLFMPGEVSREMLHAAQVDEPEERQVLPEEKAQAEDEELQAEEEEQLQAEETGAMYDTREEWDTLRELLEDKEVERMMADRAVLPEPSENTEREPERPAAEQKMPEQKTPEQQMPEQKMPEQKTPEQKMPEQKKSEAKRS